MEIRIDKSRAGCMVVTMVGDLRDGVDLDLGRVIAQADQPLVRIDASGIDAVNSLGIASWIRFMGKLDAKAKVEIEKIPAILVFFAGQIPNFFGKAQLKTFYVPLVCESCSNQSQELIDAQRLKKEKGIPAAACSKCSAALVPEFDAEGFLDVLLPYLAAG